MSHVNGTGCVLVHSHPSLLLPVKKDLRTRDGTDYREFFDRFTEDIRERGVQQPLLCYREGERYRVLDGESRRLASLIAGLGWVPVLVYDQEPDEPALALAKLQANAMRQDMTPLEYARVYKQLMDLHGWSQVELAQQVKASPGKVSKVLSILTKLPEDVQAMIGEGKDKLCLTAAAALTRLETPEAMREVAKQSLGMKRDSVDALIAKRLGKKGGNGQKKSIKLSHGGVVATVTGDPLVALKLFLAKAQEAIRKIEKDQLPPDFLGGLMA